MDRFQQRHPLIGFPVAVVYKFFDDQGNLLAAMITYYAFVAIFPLLLIGSSVLGFILQGNPQLRDTIFNSALHQFPIIGGQFRQPDGLEGSTAAVVVGSLAAVYGALGLGQASQHLMNIAWAVPRNSRPNPFVGRLRSLMLLAMAGIAVLVVTLFTALGSSERIVGAELGTPLRVVMFGATIALNAFVFMLLFRMATVRKHSLLAAAPGALSVAVMWQGLQYAGAFYVERVIARANQVNGTFALVLGLIALIYVAAVMAVLGVEINVVRTKRLYPRALLTPFTDNVDLTTADRRAYSDYAKAMRHKGFEVIRVRYRDRDTGGESR